MTSTSTIYLDRPDQVPSKFSEELSRFDSAFEQISWLEDLDANREFKHVLAEIDSFLCEGRIAVYHCTKEISAGFYKTNGLRILDMQSHIKEFLKTIQPIVDARLMSLFEEGLLEWQNDNSQTRYREAKIWFVFTPQLVISSGTQSLFRYFGGEAIY